MVLITFNYHSFIMQYFKHEIYKLKIKNGSARFETQSRLKILEFFLFFSTIQKTVEKLKNNTISTPKTIN